MEIQIYSRRRMRFISTIRMGMHAFNCLGGPHGDNLIITLDLLIRPKGGGAAQRDRFFLGAV